MTDDDTDAQVKGMAQIIRDQQNGSDDPVIAAEQTMRKIVLREKSRNARIKLKELNERIAGWPSEAERAAAIAAKQKEREELARQVVVAQDRRARAPKLIYKVHDPDEIAARQAERDRIVEYHRRTTQRARELLGRADEPVGHIKQTNGDLVYKVNPSALQEPAPMPKEIPPSTDEERAIEKRLATRRPGLTVEQHRAIFEMFADFSALMGAQCGKLDRMVRDDVTRYVTKKLTELEYKILAAENTRLRSMLNARSDDHVVTDFDFNAARAAVRN